MSSPVEYAVLHAMQDLMREGVHPSGDRLVDYLEDYPEDVIRVVRSALVRSGKVVLMTTQDGPEPEDLDEISEEVYSHVSRVGADTLLGHRARKVVRSKEVSLAILRLIEGRGSVCRSIAVLTGLSENAVKMRARNARTEFSSEEIDGDRPDELDPTEQRYLQRRYGSMDKREVQDYLGRTNAPHRRSPDTRTA